MTTDSQDRRPAVQATIQGAVLVVSIDNPPVNALSQAVREGLLGGVQAGVSDPNVQAVLIVGSGANFLGGADIREFGRPRAAPLLPDLCNQIEASPKLIVAAIQGVALGGGLEVAMSAHYRVASASAKLGLPEVLLGLLPGAGGTQRAPRLVGLEAALDLILSGRQVGGRQALELGLIDRISDLDATQAGLAFANELIASGAPVRRTREFAIADHERANDLLQAARENIARKKRGLISPPAIVEALQAATTQPFEAGLGMERELFARCQGSEQHAGLVHAFFAEREAQKAPETRSARARVVASVGIVGGGTMGAGIAVAVLDAGLSVTLIERDPASLERGIWRVRQIYDGLVSRGRLGADARSELLDRLSGGVDYALLANADVVIEAAFEDMSVKSSVFSELDRVCKPGAILATNTSYLDVNAIAASTRRPQDVIGLHFFSPANVMKLLEVVVPSTTSPDVVATSFAFAKRLGKVPVRAGVCDGFIGNRIQFVYRQAVDHMLEDGASPYLIDEAMRGFGYPMGPFQVSDLAGGDIGWATRKRRAVTRDARSRYVQIADRLCERGWFGQKTGRGWYLYPQGSRTGVEDPEILDIVAKERERGGIKPRTFDQLEIVRRCLAAVINEGANVVADQIALRPLDVDVAYVHGYGFPRYRGGPMKYADTVGVDTILKDIVEFSKEDAFFWRPSPLLGELVQRGNNFESLNRR